mmetsp:Transcript_18212/g.47508  ORF Transcript_18212/g.47508 Transcript_18212/m.47508 type:complete len:284 (+) Transcript_18212:1770-2621(+)
MSTRDPCACSFVRSLSSTISLPPLFTMCCRFGSYGGPSSAPSNRYGWLQHLRSCIRMFNSRIFSTLPAPFSTSISLLSTFVYHSRCILERPTYTFVSFFGGRLFSTSALRRRSIKGLRSLWSFEIISFCMSPSSAVLNHASKSSCEPKTSGTMKLRSAQSSFKLFCSGVPVRRRRLRDLNSRTVTDSFDASFLMRWASSITIYRQENFLSDAFSMMQSSYDVISTSQSPGIKTSSTNAWRSSFPPLSVIVRSDGTKRLISFSQFATTDLGTMTMCGPCSLTSR